MYAQRLRSAGYGDYLLNGRMESAFTCKVSIAWYNRDVKRRLKQKAYGCHPC
jgi:hypothetical protein